MQQLAHKHVLVVEDQPVMRRYIQEMLRELGCALVTPSGDGRDALSRARSGEFDLILLDWNLPVMNGLTFIRDFRTVDRKTPVIMVTTESEREHVVQAIQAGVNNYLAKPFSQEMLAERIQQTLSRAA